jgi:hypothetical protein|tara:strand:- start:1132 stop:1329 length:198 start_codon:yes stop_codon:yes gene_type:complete
MNTKDVKDVSFDDFAKLIKEYVKVGFSEYKTVHKYGNEDEWDEEGELSNYKDVLISNVSHILEEV